MLQKKIFKNEKYKLIEKANKSIHEFYEYSYYTKMIYDLQIVKKYIFKDDDFLFLLTNFYKKANMWNPNEIKQLYGFNIKNNVIEEYKNLKDNSNMEKLISTLKKNDEYFYNLVKDDVKVNIKSLSESMKE